jgi:hypothetical protein
MRKEVGEREKNTLTKPAYWLKLILAVKPGSDKIRSLLASGVLCTNENIAGTRKIKKMFHILSAAIPTGSQSKP